MLSVALLVWFAFFTIFSYIFIYEQWQEVERVFKIQLALHKFCGFFICRAAIGIGIAILYFWQTLQTELKIYLQPFTLTLHKPCVSQAVSQAESAGSRLTGNPLPLERRMGWRWVNDGLGWEAREVGSAAAWEPLAVVICLRIGKLKISQHLKTWPINLGAEQRASERARA